MLSLKGRGIGIIELIFSLLLAIGTLTVFDVCEISSEKIMACHWANNTVISLGTVLAVQSLARVLINNKSIRIGIIISMIPTTVLCILIPDTLISLCMINNMRCQSVFKPIVIVASAVLVFVLTADLIIMSINLKKDNAK